MSTLAIPAVAAWLCDLHLIRTTTDCLACDAEQIAGLNALSEED